jgi:hypothetical protein
MRGQFLILPTGRVEATGMTKRKRDVGPFLSFAFFRIDITPLIELSECGLKKRFTD